MRISFLTIILAAFLAVLVNPGVTSAQNLRDAAREQARKKPGVPLLLTNGPGDYWPKTIEELTKEAEVVVQARLSQPNSYLAESGDRVLTDYAINVERVVAGSLPAREASIPGAVVVPLVLTVFGGDVTIDGVLIRATDNNREALMDGGRYLLFLMKSRRPAPGRYEIYYGGVFELVQGKVRPLLRDGARVFKGMINTPITELIPQIEKAAQGR